VITGQIWYWVVLTGSCGLTLSHLILKFWESNLTTDIFFLEWLFYVGGPLWSLRLWEFHLFWPSMHFLRSVKLSTLRRTQN
jgi:hypothetical protein